MMNRHESEFGASFLATLQGLLRRFIQKVEDVMPQTAIDKVPLGSITDGYIYHARS